MFLLVVAYPRSPGSKAVKQLYVCVYTCITDSRHLLCCSCVLCISIFLSNKDFAAVAAAGSDDTDADGGCSEVVLSEEFLNLPIDQVSKLVADDQLAVASEEQVLCCLL